MNFEKNISTQSITWPEFKKMRSDWSRLCELSQVDPLFLDWQWITGWWEHFSSDNDLSFRGVVVRGNSNNVIGLVPFVLWHAPVRGSMKIKRLQLLGNLHAGPITMRTEYNNLLIDPDYLPGACEALVEHLLENSFWDDMVIQDADARSRSVSLFADLLSLHTHFRSTGNEIDDRAWSVNTKQSFDQYLRQLSPNTRRRLFNRRQYLGSLGKVELEYATEKTIEAFFDDLNRLHKIRWGQPVFSDKRLLFHIDLARSCADNGQLAMSRLTVNGEPISVLYNLRAGRREYNLQHGFDDKLFGSKLSPGLIHLGYAIEDACQNSCIDIVDLLAGRGKKTQYKTGIADTFTPLRTLQFVRHPIYKVMNRVRDKRRKLSCPHSPVNAIPVIVSASTNAGFGTALSLQRHAKKPIGISYSRNKIPSKFRQSQSSFFIDRKPASLFELLLAIGNDNQDLPLVLFPCDDFSVNVISDNRHALRKLYRFLLPSTESLQLIQNKSRFFEWATRKNYPVPNTLVAQQPDELESAIGKINRPLMVKPHIKSKTWYHHFPGKNYLLLQAGDELPIGLPSKLFQISDEYIVQEWIPSAVHGDFFCLCFFDKSNNLRARVAGQSLIVRSNYNGGTISCVTEVDPKVLDLAGSVLSAAGLVGLGSVKIKRHAESGVDYIVSIAAGRNVSMSHITDKAGANLSQMALYESLNIPCAWKHLSNRANWADPSIPIGPRRFSYKSMPPKGLRKLLRQQPFLALEQTKGVETGKVENYRYPNYGRAFTRNSPVLVLDGDQDSTLSIVRSLGKMGLDIHVGAIDQSAITFHSKYVTEQFIYPDPMENPHAFQSELLAKIQGTQPILVIPVTDRTIVPLMDIRERVETHAPIAMASNNAIQTFLSKHKTSALAEKLGVPIPASVNVANEMQLARFIANANYPVVIKPERSKRWVSDGKGRDLQVEYAANEKELQQRVTRMLGAGPLQLQEKVNGQGVGLSVIARNGHCLFAFQYHRLHEVPLTGGASSYRESEAIDPMILSWAKALLAEVHWDGVAMFEFKRSNDSGQVWLMEANGRFWGSLPLAISSGADFPAYLFLLMVQGDDIFPDSYRIGMRCRRLATEFEWLKQAVRRPPTKLGYKGVFIDTFRWLNPHERTDTFSLADLRPGWVDLWRIARSQITAVKKRIQIWRVARTMKNISRTIGTLEEYLFATKTIIFVCHGNIIRSAYCVEKLRYILGQNSPIKMLSAGLDTSDGRPADPRAIAEAKKRGIDLSNHRSRQFWNPDETGLIVAMESQNVISLMEKWPHLANRTLLLGCFLGDGFQEITDPYSRGPEIIKERFDQIDNAIEHIADVLEKRRYTPR